LNQYYLIFGEENKYTVYELSRNFNKLTERVLIPMEKKKSKVVTFSMKVSSVTKWTQNTKIEAQKRIKRMPAL